MNRNENSLWIQGKGSPQSEPINNAIAPILNMEGGDLLKISRAFKDRRRSDSVMKKTEADPNGRYGILTAGTVPAVSIQNGV